MKKNYSISVIRFLPLLMVFTFLVGILAFRGQIITEIKKSQLKDSTVSNELLSQAYLDRILNSDGRFHKDVEKAVWFNREVLVPASQLESRILANPQVILGESTDTRWIEVDLSAQRLYAHEGNRIVYNMAISSGLPWFPTPTGDFRLWSKVRSQRMAGGSIADGTYYDLPNVPFVQYFYGGYGLHGAYWHNDFGKPRSHGCVNLSIANAETLYYWTQPQLGPNEYVHYNIKPDAGTRVVVHGTTPTTL